MKSAYELAMDRLNKTAPTVKMTAAQKREIAEIDSLLKAKLAEREIFIQGEIATMTSKGDFETVQQLERQMISERKALLAGAEEKKEAIRQASK
ncbi:MAG TPA: hypothetical protein VK968_18515 [Roseimicrobium sp.]|nr:hypothetical protein [Roseimicrobium sp.]